MEQPQIKIEDTTAIVCNKCRSQVFQENFLLRKTNKFVTGTSDIIQYPVMACANCGSINDEFLPKGFLK